MIVCFVERIGELSSRGRTIALAHIFTVSLHCHAVACITERPNTGAAHTKKKPVTVKHIMYLCMNECAPAEAAVTAAATVVATQCNVV